MSSAAQQQQQQQQEELRYFWLNEKAQSVVTKGFTGKKKYSIGYASPTQNRLFCIFLAAFGCTVAAPPLLIFSFSRRARLILTEPCLKYRSIPECTLRIKADGIADTHCEIEPREDGVRDRVDFILSV